MRPDKIGRYVQIATLSDVLIYRAAFLAISCTVCPRDRIHARNYPDSKVPGANMGPTIGPRWTPCWPQEPCNQGSHERVSVAIIFYLLVSRPKSRNSDGVAGPVRDTLGFLKRGIDQSLTVPLQHLITCRTQYHAANMERVKVETWYPSRFLHCSNSSSNKFRKVSAKIQKT